jgi:hypothetical protein
MMQKRNEAGKYSIELGPLRKRFGGRGKIATNRMMVGAGVVVGLLFLFVFWLESVPV